MITHAFDIATNNLRLSHKYAYKLNIPVLLCLFTLLYPISIDFWLHDRLDKKHLKLRYAGIN